MLLDAPSWWLVAKEECGVLQLFSDPGIGWMLSFGDVSFVYFCAVSLLACKDMGRLTKEQKDKGTTSKKLVRAELSFV